MKFYIGVIISVNISRVSAFSIHRSISIGLGLRINSVVDAFLLNYVLDFICSVGVCSENQTMKPRLESIGSG